MESLSRPFHRRKLSNANSFSGKNAYDGVFSGHRPKFDGVPAVNVAEYREIFGSGQAASSIPVLDLSTLQESSDGSNLERGSTKPDYGNIFGGFRDEDIAVSYEELVARDKARTPLSTSQSSQDLDDDLSHQSIDALKQFNMSYHKISQRSKDGLDGTTTTHVTQLHVVPGFTCFIDESASQPKKETKNQKSSMPNNVHSPEKQTSQTAFESKSKYHQDDKKFNLKSHNSKVSSLPTPSAVKTESASQPKMESEKKTSSETVDVFLEKQTSQSAVESESKHHQDESLSDDKKIKNLESHNSKVSSSSPAAFATNGKPTSQPKMETEKKKPSETSLEKQTSKSAVESKSKYHQDESLSDDKKIDLKSNNSKASSLPAVSATNGKPTLQPKKETEKKKTSEADADVLEIQTSKSAAESRSKYNQDESLSDEKISKKFDADINFHFSRGSSSSSLSSPATSETNHKDYQKRSTSEASSFWTWKSDTPGAFSSTFLNEELDVNSTAGASAAALRKAIEKAQESIRIAKESVGRKKEGLKSFSRKSFKDSLKVKARVESVSTDEEQKEKDNWIKEIFKARMGASVSTSVGRNHKNEDTSVFSESTDGEKHFGANNEMNGKKLELEKNSEMPIGSCHELKENKIDCDSKEVLGETKDVEYATRSSEEVENNPNESLQKDNQRPNDFLVIESGENKAGDTKDTIQDHKPIELKENEDEVGPSNAHELAEETEETNNLTLCQEVEDEKKVLVFHDSDQNGYEKRFSESLGLLENAKQDVLEQEHNVEVESEESHEPNNDDEASEKVVEEEIELKEDNDTESHMEEDTSENFYDVCEVETIENSSSDYDDAEESESIHGANHIETNTAKVDQNVESSQEVDDVSNSLPQVTVEDTEATNTEEKEIFETISADQTASINHEDEGEEKSESCSDTIHGMEIEIKECKETEEKETIKKEEEEEEINLQESHSERPEVIFEMETGTSEQPKESDSDANKVMEKDVDQKKIEQVTNEERERERNRVAVERAIREARERAFNETRERVAVERANAEVRQRVMAGAQEKATKASAAMKASDVISSKIKAERAAVERATAEARQRALEKAMSQTKASEPKIEVNDDLHVSVGTSAESAQRSKAKLEKHNRIMERAAKALAEKEKRDQLAQKEQAERNRLAENLDADIKRWSTGKEGNLRALLSTLQYILGPESGWQSVPLTEIITTSAVKKAYRKATLCVHPDKLQQRGASIQHKYICEKVFDLLKAAWNKFNSEER